MLYEKEIGSRDFCGGILYYVCYGKVWAEKSTVLEQVIYDENNIKVSVSEASLDAEQNIGIPLHIENNTDKKWV